MVLWYFYISKNWFSKQNGQNKYNTDPSAYLHPKASRRYAALQFNWGLQRPRVWQRAELQILIARPWCYGILSYQKVLFKSKTGKTNITQTLRRACTLRRREDTQLFNLIGKRKVVSWWRCGKESVGTK